MDLTNYMWDKLKYLPGPSRRVVLEVKHRIQIKNGNANLCEYCQAFEITWNCFWKRYHKVYSGVNDSFANDEYI